MGGLSHPLLVGDTWDGIAGKLQGPRSALAPQWQHFIRLSRSDPEWYAPYTVLTAVLTKDAEDCARARQAFLRFVELQAEGEISIDAQYHTHVVTAPLGRWAIYYDWIADLGWFSPAEDRRVREYLLHFGNIFALQHVQSRRLEFDNQVLANAFSATAVGHVLGYKRGDSALARRMYHSGLAALQIMLARIPAGGYSGEGSTYQEHVVAPLTLLSALLIEEITGVAMLRGETPVARSIQEMLALAYDTMGPSGLLPAWDDYGFQAATNKMVLTYLARLTQDPRPLAAIRDLHLWYRPTLPAWELDDRLWTLLWWPATMNAAVPSFQAAPWMRPEICGALVDQPRQLRLFQYWDRCYGVPFSGRAQVDPNAITLEAFGSPILVDGNGELDPALAPVPTASVLTYIGERTRASVGEYFFSAWGVRSTEEELTRRAMSGSVSCANALILDGESWYVPLSPVQGHGEALHAHGELQVLRSDATAIYRDRYDVSAVTRTSVLVKGQYLLVSDRVCAATPHQVTWQAFLRRQVTHDSLRMTVETPELVHCDLIPLQPGTWALAPVSNYPKNLDEGKSVRTQFTVPASCDVRLDMALLPQLGYQIVEDITDGWECTIAGKVSTVSLTSAYLNDPMEAPETPRTYRRQVIVERAASRELYLNLGIASSELRVLVNGVAIAPTATQTRGIWQESSTYLPFFFDLSSALREGGNEITLIAPYFHGETICGPARLCEPLTVSPVGVQRTGEDTFSITVGTEHDELIVERTQRCAPWLDGETDARYAVRSAAGAVTACAVTRLQLPGGVSFQSSCPLDFCWSQERASLSALPRGALVTLQWEGGDVRIKAHGALQIVYHGHHTYPLALDIEPEQQVLVNGVCMHAADGMPHRAHSVLLSPVAAAPSAPIVAEEVYRLAEVYGAQAGDMLVDALRSDDWTVQLAAADVIGELGLTQAVPMLLTLFAEAEAEIPYPPLRKCWRGSKRLRLSNDEGSDPDLPMPIGVKRWRVKRAVVTALGKLGDQRAVVPLEQALLRCDDFFPVQSQLAVALGRLGASSSIAVLERCLHHAEVNLRFHAQLSYALLCGELDPQIFEAQVGSV
ncbi:MAG: HEAT repeat domain-containing protein [Armatimonadota bacterium]